MIFLVYNGGTGMSQFDKLEGGVCDSTLSWFIGLGHVSIVLSTAKHTCET